jgi:hypothetical protein
MVLQLCGVGRGYETHPANWCKLVQIRVKTDRTSGSSYDRQTSPLCPCVCFECLEVFCALPEHQNTPPPATDSASICYVTYLLEFSRNDLDLSRQTVPLSRNAKFKYPNDKHT